MERLKPCPFCGAEAKLFIAQRYKRLVEGSQEWWEVTCPNKMCFFNPGVIFAYKDDAINAWNTRSDDWISVKDRLPETIPSNAGTEYSEAVMVLTSGRKVLSAIYDGTDFICAADFWEAEGEEITHWKSVLPLPKEYTDDRT